MSKPNKETDRLITKTQRQDDCFACMTPFKKYCWVHPLYPGERLCKTCYEKTCEDFKIMWRNTQ